MRDFRLSRLSYSSGVSLTLDDEVAAVRIGGLFDLQVEVGAVQVQEVAEKIAGHADIHLHGIDEDGARRQAHGQRPAVAVEDRAARRGYFDHHFLYGAGLGRVLPVMDDLQRDEVLENCRAPQQDDDGETCKTALDHDAQREEIHASRSPYFAIATAPWGLPSRWKTWPEDGATRLFSRAS